jgi:tetratricopeptide (TPR) repeat protein/transcriptional regulator with XRE-family HTH domain
VDGESFGDLLRRHRVAAYLTQETLAERSGVSVHGISMLERGARRAPWPRTVGQLAAALGLDARQREALESAARGRGPEPSDPRTGLPPKPSPYFVGREGELAELRRQLGHGGCVAVHGMAGVGKTQLAARYARQERAAYPGGVLWLRAAEESTLLGDLAGLAWPLALPERRQREQERHIAAVVRWLRQHPNWLLVLDNLEPAAWTAAEHWLAADLPGHLLATSRTPMWPVRLALEPLPLEPARRFLLRRTGQGDVHAADEVAETLGRLPLALAQAAAYVDVSGRDLTSYAELLRTRLVELMNEARPEDYPHTLATTWQLSFERLKTDRGAAVALLRLCAYLGPDEIPIGMLQAGAGAVPDELRAALADDVELDRTIAVLRRYSLAQRDGDRLRIHRLVQAVVRETMRAAGEAEWLPAAIRLLERVVPDAPHRDTRHWPLCARALAHAQAVDLAVGDRQVEPQAHSRVLTRIGAYLFARGEYRSARRLFERALAIRERALGGDHPDTAQSLDDVGMTLYMLHEPAAARRLVERALAIRERVLGADDPLTAICVRNLALLLHEQGELAAARSLFERALATDERVEGPDHRSTIESCIGLALLLRDQGDPAATATLLERALGSCERTLGPDHPLTARVLDALAVLHLGRGDPTSARSLAERSLAIRERVLGPDHRHTAMTLDHLASAVMAQGDLSAARALLERAVETRERVLGPDHPHTADSVDNLGILLQRQGDSAGARGLVERALGIRERTLGPDHPYTADSLENLAILRQQQGDSIAAGALIGRALAIRERALGRDHPDTVRSRRLAGLSPERLGGEALRAGGTAR